MLYLKYNFKLSIIFDKHAVHVSHLKVRCTINSLLSALMIGNSITDKMENDSPKIDANVLNCKLLTKIIHVKEIITSIY